MNLIKSAYNLRVIFEFLLIDLIICTEATTYLPKYSMYYPYVYVVSISSIGIAIFLKT